MSGFIPRILAALVAMALGGLAGLLIGPGEAAVPGVFAGGALAVAIIVIVDRLHGLRLLRWLRDGHEGSAPRDRGYWGELAYRIERALRASEQSTRLERQRLAQFLSAIEASPSGVLLLGASDQIEWCNSRAAAHFGLDPVRDRGQRVTNLIRAPAFVAHLQARDHDEPVVFAAPGGNATLTVRVRPYGENNKLVLTQDTTERERADAMRRDFVANVSHEIRTPLTVLTGSLETLATLPLSDAERARLLEMMMQQAARMETLVGDLLTLAQLEGSPPPGAEHWVELGSVFDEVEAAARALSAGRHALRVDRVDGVQIAGSRPELLSAVGNLVNNAVRYTQDGGQITVAWRLTSDGTGEIAVSDTGPGIAREHLPRLTERFYRVDGSRSRETGGTGLGLSIVKHVAQRHSGELHVHSELGKGSTFRLLLPAARVRDAGRALGAVPRHAAIETSR